VTLPGIFYLFWLPKYLYDARGFNVKLVGALRGIPMPRRVLAVCLRVVLQRVWCVATFSVNIARKLALGLSAAVMPFVIFVPYIPVSWAIVIFSLAYFGQQSWSTLVMVLPTDLFPASIVGSVAGLVGFGAPMGGVVLGEIVGYLLDMDWLRSRLPDSRQPSSDCVPGYPTCHTDGRGLSNSNRNCLRGSPMKITEVRTRVLRWRGKTVPLPPHFCTNPMDLLELPEASMQTFTFHDWLIIEILTDQGHVGIGNGALAPQVTKQSHRPLSQSLLIGQIPGTPNSYGNTCIARPRIWP